MKVARLWNPQGGFCREWKGNDLDYVVEPTSRSVLLTDKGKALAFIFLGTHTLVLEEEREVEE